MGDGADDSDIYVVAGVDRDAVVHPGETTYQGKFEVSIAARRSDDAGAAASGCGGCGGVAFNYGGNREANTRFSERRWKRGTKTEIE